MRDLTQQKILMQLKKLVTVSLLCFIQSCAVFSLHDVVKIATSPTALHVCNIIASKLQQCYDNSDDYFLEVERQYVYR